MMLLPTRRAFAGASNERTTTTMTNELEATHATAKEIATFLEDHGIETAIQCTGAFYFATATWGKPGARYTNVIETMAQARTEVFMELQSRGAELSQPLPQEFSNRGGAGLERDEGEMRSAYRNRYF